MAQKAPAVWRGLVLKKILKYSMNLEEINKSANKLNIIFLFQAAIPHRKLELGTISPHKYEISTQ